MGNDSNVARARAAVRGAKTAVSLVDKALAGNFTKAVAFMRRRKGRIIVTGIGKSGFVGQKIAATLTSLGRPALFLHPVEALHGDIGILEKQDMLLALSFSGTTSEVVRLAKYVRRAFKVPVISITGSDASPLALASDAAITFAIRGEGSPTGLAPMASTTATLVVGDALAAALAPDDFGRAHFGRLHPHGTLGYESRTVGELMKKGSAVPAVPSGLPLKAAVQKIDQKKLGITAVTDTAGKLIGVITDGDIRRFVMKHESIRGFSAKDAMTRRPRIIPAEASLKDALTLMERHKITTLFILDAKRRPAGLVHLHAIIENDLA